MKSVRCNKKAQVLVQLRCVEYHRLFGENADQARSDSPLSLKAGGGLYPTVTWVRCDRLDGHF
ncbi:Uncharacterised protein [Serratia fonticola]|nr:Uncharacterised protein [Serratia fonticola]